MACGGPSCPPFIYSVYIAWGLSTQLQRRDQGRGVDMQEQGMAIGFQRAWGSFMGQAERVVCPFVLRVWICSSSVCGRVWAARTDFRVGSLQTFAVSELGEATGVMVPFRDGEAEASSTGARDDESPLSGNIRRPPYLTPLIPSLTLRRAWRAAEGGMNLPVSQGEGAALPLHTHASGTFCEPQVVLPVSPDPPFHIAFLFPFFFFCFCFCFYLRDR